MFLRRERNPRVFIQFYFNFKDKGVVLKAARIALKKQPQKYIHIIRKLFVEEKIWFPL